MSFEQPPPDLGKIIAAWNEFEDGESMPGRVLADMKTAGLGVVLAELAASGWAPTGATTS